ncbi:amidase domain-containing protein [Paenibacillus sp. P32E]|uniref:amidase domain-containing protein n=1 Tax=Paenibacillus sp. P32E TaxID=1349434 RepID=UPI00093A6195|nr:amidase domain-containing protein [Paenibacillus sp. P32E]OKP87358.1 hypothetical protein A3848_20605 [Paenibacillus sp. P32E]
MEQKWKKSLYVYVDQVNKGRVAPGVDQPRSSAVRDPRFLLEQGERSRRLAQWYKRRGITPLRSETGVRTLRTVRQNPSEVVADVALHSALYYEKGGITHREDVIETERLTFVSEGGAWEITAVERSVPERNSMRKVIGPEPLLRLSKWGEVLPVPQPSQPLLNKSILRSIASGKEVRYRREEAAAYADRWWKDGNPEFEVFDVDCTNYVSQCLFAGGAPINYTGKRETGWWYKGYNGAQEWWSFSWAVSDSLQRYLSAVRSSGLRAEAVERADQLMLGDVIQYDWDGNGHYQHSTIVTAFDAAGQPLVNARTVSSRHRFWDYRDSYAWTDRTAYRFFHINDYL